EPSHALHTVEEGGGIRRAAEQVIIEKVQMPAGQSADLRQRGLDRLHIEFLPAFEEGDLVTEVADVGAAAGNDDGIRHQVLVAPDEVTPDRRHAQQRPMLCGVAAAWMTSLEVLEESRPGILARAQ